ncbi:MAG: response regulator transcription factor [Caldibacillus thermoamylovorans]|uniref:response regulator transcription factor n=1 Tax=Bacillaceae TaxID=186817 RepID=UPI000D553395|nr:MULTISPECIES: response regulator transcription factor [Bacillaceae]AWI11171.1 DNA-binding response regulator [Caldibacillus thermoamylovorans]MBU5340814.1 response regulator transcription factor [Caldifermentibacillus hisashii]MCB7071407.1 response regulator transcription factor [Caldibacillus sp. 210928-DFI.2.22]MCB7074889.1 response regulator transcription factor [Caldibacillus sp. 210928-DFI.2.18]
MKVLVIEDNENVCSMIDMFFINEGINGTFIHDGKEGYERAMAEDWDLLIIDWMLPGMDGVTICRKIREEQNNVPIIILTAKDSESDQVLGLEMGADDYVTKPFSPLALMARIKAVMRRAQYTTQGEVPKDVVQTKHFKVNKETREVWLDDEQIMNLTPKEFDLLIFFLQHPRQVFSREQILDQVWGYQFYGDERTVDVHIKRLRKKLGKENQPFFHTVWGVGYKFDELVDK